MEKWKIGVIVLLLAGFGFFQWKSNGGDTSTENALETPTSAATVTATPLPEMKALMGTTPHAWSVPSALWINTPKPITLADLKGSVALIEFWRLECSHCQEAVPFMNALHERYKDKGLKIVTFQSPGALKPENPENDWKTVQTFARTRNISYPVAFDTNRQIKNKYPIEYYPLVFVLDRQGRIQLVQTGHTREKSMELVRKIDELLKKK